jgi:hypothetical protein
MDTNINEAFNQVCTWFAPKNKVFAGSGSLHNRISFAIGINSLGYNEFFTRVFQKLGVNMTNNVSHYLRLRENSRVQRLTKIRTKDARLAKTEKKRTKLRADIRVAKGEFLRREGTYRKGINLDDPYGEVPANGNEDDGDRKPAAKSNSSKLFCEYCGLKGHATTKSRKCIKDNHAPKAYSRLDGSLLVVATPAVANDDENDDDGFLMPTEILDENHQVDCHQNDLIPLDTEVQDDYGSDYDLFHDANTWSEDELVEVPPPAPVARRGFGFL